MFSEDRIFEWFFTADIKPFQVAILVLAMYLGKAFLEYCYGRRAQ